VKKILGLVVIVAIGYLGYNHFFNKSLSPDEREFKRIEDAYDSAMSRYGRSNRMLSVSGMDVTSDIEDVINTVEGLKKELADLKDHVADDKLLRKVADLGSKIEKFLSDKH
jgi:hypothetical protein